MKNEKVQLIGNQALEIARLKREMDLILSKIYRLYLDDLLSYELKYSLGDHDCTVDKYKEKIEKEKESK